MEISFLSFLGAVLIGLIGSYGFAILLVFVVLVPVEVIKSHRFSGAAGLLVVGLLIMGAIVSCLWRFMEVWKLDGFWGTTLIGCGGMLAFFLFIPIMDRTKVPAKRRKIALAK